MNRPLLRLAAALCCLPLALAAAEPHVHGQARLDVAVEGDTLTLIMKTPADSLVGFEHEPRSAQERDAAAQARKQLEQPEALFLPSRAAACEPVKTALESPLFGAQAAPHAHAAHPDEDAHAHIDVDGTFVFRCAHPEALRDLEVDLFGAFPRLQRLDVQLASPEGQKALRLTPEARRLSW